MSSEQPAAHLAADHYEPLRWLVRERLHKGMDLAELVKRARWKRKRPSESKQQ